jgi:aminopeptidase N
MQPLYLEATRGLGVYHAYLDSLRAGIENRTPVAPRESRTTGQIYGGDIYDKGAWVLHTLRYLIGDAALRAALREMAYPTKELEAVTNGRQTRFATTDDFLRIAEATSGMDLGWFFEVYLRQPRLPVLVEARTAKGLTLRWRVPGERPFPMPVDVALGDRVQRVKMTNGSATIPLQPGESAVVDPDHWILRGAEGSP